MSTDDPRRTPPGNGESTGGAGQVGEAGAKPWIPSMPSSFGTGPAAPARRYDVWLGGKDNFGPDRKSAEKLTRVFPDAALAVGENRRFLHRVVHHLAELGVRQFVDVGVGMPHHPNVHDIAQAVDPSCRVMYVDNDPMVMVNARALLTGTAEGRIGYIQADLRQPHTILADPALAGTLDLTRPVAVLIVAVLHFIPDIEHPQAAVRTLLDALPPGSYLALSHGTTDYMNPDMAAAITAMSGRDHGPLVPRTRAQVAAFTDGLELVEPGLVPTADWHRPTDSDITPAQCAAYGAIAQKP
jgi:S-adenosyl methyltransferase